MSPKREDDLGKGRRIRAILIKALNALAALLDFPLIFMFADEPWPDYVQFPVSPEVKEEAIDRPDWGLSILCVATRDTEYCRRGEWIIIHLRGPGILYLKTWSAALYDGINSAIKPFLNDILLFLNLPDEKQEDNFTIARYRILSIRREWDIHKKNPRVRFKLGDEEHNKNRISIVGLGDFKMEPVNGRQQEGFIEGPVPDLMTAILQEIDRLWQRDGWRK